MQPLPTLLLLTAAALAPISQSASQSASQPATLPASPNPAAYTIDKLLFTDPLNNLDQWKAELEQPGAISAKDGILEINVPRGCSLWFTHELSGPVLIQYDARMLQANPPGPNDRVSDLNCFWMATDPRNEKDFFDVPARTGAFATYNQLHTYYVGQGGNTNTTTRFRRYIGDASNRPLLPQHDLSDKQFLLSPNTWQHLQLVACNHLIEYYRDGKRIFSYTDPTPYTHGYFALRTTFNHMQLRNFSIYHLTPTTP